MKNKWEQHGMKHEWDFSGYDKHQRETIIPNIETQLKRLDEARAALKKAIELQDEYTAEIANDLFQDACEHLQDLACTFAHVSRNLD